jgi:hypothetical protein
MFPLETERLATSGERLQALLDMLELSPYRFAGYYAGFSLGEPIRQQEKTARGQRFRAFKRSMHRWLADEFTVADDSAVEVVTTANRLLAERGQEPLPLNYLVTPGESRQASIAELRAMLAEVLERLARLEERLP